MTLSQLVDALAIQPQKAPHLGRLMRFLKTQGLFEIKNVGDPSSIHFSVIILLALSSLVLFFVLRLRKKIGTY